MTAAVLLVMYEVLFRVYERYLLHASKYGSVAAFASVILVFLYNRAFILRSSCCWARNSTPGAPGSVRSPRTCPQYCTLCRFTTRCAVRRDPPLVCHTKKCSDTAGRGWDAVPRRCCGGRASGTRSACDSRATVVHPAASMRGGHRNVSGTVRLFHSTAMGAPAGSR